MVETCGDERDIVLAEVSNKLGYVHVQLVAKPKLAVVVSPKCKYLPRSRHCDGVVASTSYVNDRVIV